MSRKVVFPVSNVQVDDMTKLFRKVMEKLPVRLSLVGVTANLTFPIEYLHIGIHYLLHYNAYPWQYLFLIPFFSTLFVSKSFFFDSLEKHSTFIYTLCIAKLIANLFIFGIHIVQQSTIIFWLSVQCQFFFNGLLWKDSTLTGHVRLL